MMWAGAMGFYWIWMVVFWVAVIGLVVWAVARLAPAGSARSDGSARRTIDERYARGELDEEEYRRRRDEVGR